MKASIKQISEITGFSPATISNALNHKKGVNQKTAERIFQVAKEIGYISENKITKINRHSPYLSITLHKCYPYYLFGISTFPSSVYHSIALRKFSITIV